MLCGDMHSHTTWSDGEVSPGRRVVAALQAGCSLMAVTDHDTLCGSMAARAFAGAFRLPITIPSGIEFSTDRGHVLVFGLHHNPYEGRKGTAFSLVRELADEQNAVLILAHPNWNANRVAWESGLLHQQRLAGDFDGFEIVNMVEDYSELLAYYDKYGPFPISCGSDSHHYPHRQEARLWVPVEGGDVDGVLKALRSGTVAVEILPDLVGRCELAVGRHRWIGDPAVITEAQQETPRPRQHMDGLQMYFDVDTVAPEEHLTLTIAADEEMSVCLQLPEAGIDDVIHVQAGKPWTTVVKVSHERCHEYVYAVVSHKNGWDIADCYIAPAECPVVDHEDMPLGGQLLSLPRFSGWDALIPQSIPCDAIETASFPVAAQQAWAWDEKYCYCQVRVEKDIHCQPHEHGGLWEGDCIRLGIQPARKKINIQDWEKINKERHPIAIPLDGALVNGIPILAINWKQHQEGVNGNRLQVLQDTQGCTYQFTLCWSTLGIHFDGEKEERPPVLNCNGQIHIHTGTQYLGHVPFRSSADLQSPSREWYWSCAE